MKPGDINCLIVDDVNAIRVQLKDLLRAFGFKRISTVGGGEEAREMLLDTSHNFHLILADWHMEPMNGVDLLRFIRKHPVYKNVPFIMVTAETTKESVMFAIKEGVDDYLIKPLTILQVQNKVYAVLIKKGVL